MARTAASRRPAPPTLVLLVRHGQTPTTGKVLPGRAPGLHLAETGLAQAQAVAERISALQGPKRKIAAVYASPLERTRQTATPIAKALGPRVQTPKRLLGADFGEWTRAAQKKPSQLPAWSNLKPTTTHCPRHRRHARH